MDFSDTSAPEPCSRLAGPASTTCDDELRSDSFEEISEILQERLNDMQELVCYLLRKNQELRMGILVDRQSSPEIGIVSDVAGAGTTDSWRIREGGSNCV
jgi:hypothetical protein